MEHPSDDELALTALGEPSGDADTAAHLDDCERCAAEVASLAATARVGRSAMSLDRLATPEPRVWAAIAAELGIPVEADAAEPPAPSPAPVRRLRAVAVLAAAAAVAIAAVGFGMWALAPRGEIEATARLDAFPDWTGAAGTATLATTGDGDRTLRVDLDGVEVPTDDDTELWLIDPDTSELVSLGLIRGSGGSFEVPADVDVDRFSIVDVSAEPDDGDPAHSGDSIVRGALES